MPISEIYTIWPEAASKVAAAAVDVQVNWTDESKSELEVKAEVRFIYDYSNVHYGISCVLVADGLSDPDWEQSNAYAGKTGDPDVPGKWGEIFTNGSKEITGLVFNDVALGIKDLKGDHESIPTDIIAGEKYVYSTSFILDELGAVADLAKKYKDNLRAVVVLVDRDNTGKALNCNTSLPIGKSTGIYATGVRTEVVSTRWYDLQGRPLMAPTTGLNIRLDILSDGSHRVSKVMTR